jgi:glycosyltransferase involved in cell wall biosynthesis
MNTPINNNSPFKRHCMVVHAYYPIGEPRVERQALALVAKGFQVDLICLKDQNDPSTDSIEGVNIYRLPVRRHKGKGIWVQLFEYLSFFILAFLKLSKLQWKQRYAVVQVHNLPDFLVFCALIPKLMGARIILDLHDLMPEFYAGRFNQSMNALPIRLLRMQEKISCAFANQVITVTGLWRETLIQRGIPADKIVVVMNVANDRIFQRRERSSMLTESGQAFRLIYHGTLTHRYGIDLAIHAVDKLRTLIPRIHLTIHGKGEFLENLIELTNQLGLEAHIEFSTQYIPIAELPRLISNAHVGLVPYRQDIFTDGILPTKMMEYVALGVPVIAARTSAISAYFDEKMVHYFSPGNIDELANAIMTLYSNHELRNQLPINADRFFQQYNWKQIAGFYVESVERLGAAV